MKVIKNISHILPQKKKIEMWGPLLECPIAFNGFNNSNKN